MNTLCRSGGVKKGEKKPTLAFLRQTQDKKAGSPVTKRWGREQPFFMFARLVREIVRKKRERGLKIRGKRCIFIFTLFR